MHTRTRFGIHSAAAITLSLATLLAGCKSQPAGDDAGLTALVQARIVADQNLTGQTIQATVAGGVATLNGAVSSEAARTIASGDAGQVAGVKTVVNNLVVQAQPVSASVAAPEPAPIPVQPASPVQSAKIARPAAAIPARRLPPPPPQQAPIVRNVPQAPPPMVAQEAPPAPVQQPVAPPPPPPPVVHTITLPAGTSVPVRITQTLDSASTQTGDRFTGAIATDIVVDGLVVLPQGTPVSGHVDDAKDATHFKGSSSLTISLSSITRKGERIDVATEAYTKEGEGRGKNTAEKVGGGAAVGAILGGIFGGGKGAAIGAAAGGGVGAGAQGVTRGQQVQIPSETVVRFQLTNPILVHVTTGGDRGAPNQTLEHHTAQ